MKLARTIADPTKRPGKAVSRSDFFPRLVAMQRFVHARNFAVFKTNNSGLASRRKLTCILDNFASDGEISATSVLDAYGQALLEHLELSSLPLLWNGRDEAQTAETPDFTAFVTRLKARVLPVCGIAMPVRLGSMGNGYTVFVANYLDITSETIIDLHARSHQMMMDLLVLDERRSAPDEVLSNREIACLQLAGDGLVSEEIAGQLGLSVHTVNAYLASATVKLDAVNRIQTIAKAIRLGYIA
ncbi:helix-turn-helix transcriptional regulator [Rhizobium sp. KVB221]|uniref:Helix-turn-helix transcriptional regulator n=1 Tax=Rhizobium setariae TaxID=2801340 RepID=A0A936YI39_9HYPH|nr:helix-turn-helix transcriptional regulator [Rhizobium setariae]MBL0370664.1 helix-turn-helix transcriptional regulator [Rhizobium setariae]